MTIQESYIIERTSKASRISTVLAAVILLILLLVPFWAGRADMRLLSELFLYLSLAYLWNLLAGYAGLVSVGQQAFVGLGGYVLFAMAIHYNVSLVVALLLAGVLGTLVAMPIALLIFRLKGAYFAIGTWVVAEVFRLCFSQISAVGAGSGVSLPISFIKSMAATNEDRSSLTYWLTLGCVILILVIVFSLLRSQRGMALMAIRDNELASKSLGIDIWMAKFQVYIFTAGLTSIVGALIFLQKFRISPEAAFSVNDWTAFVIFIVVIGGIGTIEGPIIGTVIFFLLRETLSDLGTTYLIMLGTLAIVMMLRMPNGIWGFISHKYQLELFPIRRRVIKKR